MNPWKIIGWIVLAFLALFIYSCVRVAANLSDASTATATPGSITTAAPKITHTAKSIGFTCEASGSGRYTIAKLTIQNTGGEPIPFAKLFVNFTRKGEMQAQNDGYFSPSTILPGATASADVMQQGAFDCSVQAVQDGSGNAIAVQ